MKTYEVKIKEAWYFTGNKPPRTLFICCVDGLKAAREMVGHSIKWDKYAEAWTGFCPNCKQVFIVRAVKTL